MNGRERCILGLLAASPGAMYGLDLVKQSRGRLGRGTVYVWLVRLEDRGLVSSVPTFDRRRLYSITSAGMDAMGRPRHRLIDALLAWTRRWFPRNRNG